MIYAFPIIDQQSLVKSQVDSSSLIPSFSVRESLKFLITVQLQLDFIEMNELLLQI